jgi:hypothetical protein
MQGWARMLRTDGSGGMGAVWICPARSRVWPAGEAVKAIVAAPMAEAGWGTVTSEGCRSDQQGQRPPSFPGLQISNSVHEHPHPAVLRELSTRLFVS